MESATHRPAAGAGHHEAGHSTGASPRHPAPISALARLPTACGLRCGVPAPQPPPARADGLRTGLGAVVERSSYSGISNWGFQATSQRCSSGSWKYPAYPPQKVVPAGLTILAPARLACSITASTSAALPTLWARDTSVALRGVLGGSPASCARSSRGQSASFSPD